MKLKLGDILKVTIEDHCRHQGLEPGLLTFDVYGKLLRMTDSALTLGCWVYTDGQIDDNVECITVSRGSVKKVRKLK